MKFHFGNERLKMCAVHSSYIREHRYVHLGTSSSLLLKISPSPFSPSLFLIQNRNTDHVWMSKRWGHHIIIQNLLLIWTYHQLLSEKICKMSVGSARFSFCLRLQFSINSWWNGIRVLDQSTKWKQNNVGREGEYLYIHMSIITEKQ